MIVYAIRNIFNGKEYVGATTRSFTERWGEHMYEMRHDRSKNPLYEDMREYGLDAFDDRILSRALNKDALDTLEAFWCRELRTREPYGYNRTDGGAGTPGRDVSEEERAKLTARNLGRVDRPETTIKRRLSHLGNTNAKGNKGKKLSSNHRAKLSVALVGNKRNLGRKLSDETRAKLSESKKLALAKISPEEKRARALRTWATRRANAV